MSQDDIDRILQRIDLMPDSAVVPVPVAAAHDNVGERTVWRNYPIVKIGPGRSGVSVGYLRNRKVQAA
jgi:hypothetical protein